jgi:hypothetical protein
MRLASTTQSEPEELPEWRRRSAMEQAGCFQIMIVSFVNDLLKRGYAKPLTMEDLDPLPTADHAHNLGQILQSYNARTDGSLFWFILKHFVRRYYVGALCHLTYCLSQAGIPFLIRGLVDFYSNQSLPIWRGVVLAVALIIVNEISSLAIANRHYQVSSFQSHLSADVYFVRCIEWAICSELLYLMLSIPSL